MNRLFAFLLACVFAQFSYGQKDCVRGLVPDIHLTYAEPL